MVRLTNKTQHEILLSAAHPLPGEPSDYDALMDPPIVLIGEASHGTHAFYYDRAEITQRLIAEQGFTAVAVEADWPDADRVTRFVRGFSDDQSGEKALANFRRFSTWMWRNTDALRFLMWLQQYDGSLPCSAVCTGFYGLELSIWAPSRRPPSEVAR